MAKTLRYVVIDVFTDRVLAGNPLAVFTNGEGLDADTMQSIAREMNLSETVFVLKPSAGGHARIRIFTPRVEIPFAGHPTLGTAFVLGLPLQADQVRLETGKGLVPVQLVREGARIVFGWMQQPVPTWQPAGTPSAVLQALGMQEAALPIDVYDNGPKHIVVVLSDALSVAGLRPSMAALADLPGVAAVARGEGGFHVRYFAPSAGIPEDPATGSAAGPIGVHLVRHGWAEFGQELLLSQGAELLRPSRLYARIDGAGNEVQSVQVGGSAIPLCRGEMHL